MIYLESPFLSFFLSFLGASAFFCFFLSFFSSLRRSVLLNLSSPTSKKDSSCAAYVLIELVVEGRMRHICVVLERTGEEGNKDCEHLCNEEDKRFLVDNMAVLIK
eukprot:TRINITY_DN6205_c0_g1_i1.p1 TRINITY_DN6205_c0_g1~~TRINITY_DN6205_c0_g1_i1.p1  ORF type:complete len:105 (-),score=13.26 TRINITY_DN6205_c0_g1_i1:200-514(-)